MTEAEWLACAEPRPLLKYLRGRASDRKFRLFSVACAEMALPYLGDDALRAALDAMRRHADGLAGAAEVAAARASTSNAAQAAYSSAGWGRWHLARAIWATTQRSAFGAAWTTSGGVPSGIGTVARDAVGAELTSAESIRAFRAACDEAEAREAALARDIFTPPVNRPSLVTLVLTSWVAWNDRMIPALAEAAYEDRHVPSGHLDGQRLAVLADGLEEAGCTDEEVLGHLRGAGPHVRGCWVVDLLTGRE